MWTHLKEFALFEIGADRAEDLVVAVALHAPFLWFFHLYIRKNNPRHETTNFQKNMLILSQSRVFGEHSQATCTYHTH